MGSDKHLRLLMVEDSDADAELLLRVLARGGLHPNYERVQTHEAFKAALDRESLGHHHLRLTRCPGTRDGGALADLRATGRDIPFILVSGTIVGEALAVEAMKAGAQDYVLKGDLTRLPMAVRREVREAAVRAEQAKMQRATGHLRAHGVGGNARCGRGARDQQSAGGGPHQPGLEPRLVHEPRRRSARARGSGQP